MFDIDVLSALCARMLKNVPIKAIHTRTVGIYLTDSIDDPIELVKRGADGTVVTLPINDYEVVSETLTFLGYSVTSEVYDTTFGSTSWIETWQSVEETVLEFEVE